MTLEAYWPSEDEVNRCIKPDAESASEAVLLAVHQEMPISRRMAGAEAKEAVSEKAFLEYFLSKDVPTGAHVVPITGDSGVGKSHLIRWLDAKLRLRSDSKKYVVVRIPKSASLRVVIEKILEPLPESYAAVKKAFRTALADVQPREAAIRFRGELQIALERVAKELQAQLAADPVNTRIKEKLRHALDLPNLINEPSIAPHFDESVLPRIIQRALAGKADAASDETQGQFVAADLDFPVTDFGAVNKGVARYYQFGLRARDGQGRKEAADVLNSVVDEATSHLFHLNEAVGQMTIQDVLLEIRRSLLKEGRDLVLLVEDFAALSGIQGSLLNLLIQEGVRDGEQQLATMRSAIAVTEGYLAFRDTIRTRAKYEWIIESHLQSDEEVIKRAISLCGAYLNAARIGEAELRETYAREARGDEWPPTFTHEGTPSAEAAVIEAFGAIDGRPLFPFNDKAIKTLAQDALRVGDRLSFRPRLVIDHVLRRVLIQGRSIFLRGMFPPSLTAARLSAEIEAWVSRTSMPEGKRSRFSTIALVWGNRPQTMRDLAGLSPKIFEAFKLESPAHFGELPHTPSKNDLPPSGTREETKVSPGGLSAEQEEEFRAWKAMLEAWVQGTQMAQKDANTVRQLVSRLLRQRFDWNAERMYRVEENFFISIPDARGEGQSSRLSLVLCKDSKDQQGRLRQQLAALFRYQKLYAETLDYDGSDNDLVLVGELADGLMEGAKALIDSENAKALSAGLAALTASWRMLGVPRAATRSENLIADRFIRSAHGAPSLLPADVPAAFLKWGELRGSTEGLRNELLNVVVGRAGSFQGTGKNPYGVDIVRIIECVASSEGVLDGAAIQQLPATMQPTLQLLADTRLGPLAKAVGAELKKAAASISRALGDTFDKDLAAAQIKQMTELLKERGHWPQLDNGLTAPGYLRLIEEFRSSAVAECLAATAKVLRRGGDEEGAETFVDHVAQVNLNVLVTVLKFVESTELVLDAAEARVTAEARGSTLDSRQVAMSVAQDLAGLRQDLEGIHGALR